MKMRDFVPGDLLIYHRPKASGGNILCVVIAVEGGFSLDRRGWAMIHALTAEMQLVTDEPSIMFSFPEEELDDG